MTDGRRERMGFCGAMWRTCIGLDLLMSFAYMLWSINNYGPANDGFGTHSELTEESKSANKQGLP